MKILLLLILFLISPASAKFICGEVNSIDIMTPSWFDVKTFPSTNENISSICKVSPEDFKYCCDIDVLQDKFSYKWTPGDIFQTQITDTSSGYFATPQNTSITSLGYDIAPTLTIEKAIKSISPKGNLIISETPIQVNVEISEKCFSNQTEFNTTFGKNKIPVSAICNNEKFETNKTFFLIQETNLEKTYTGFSGGSNFPKIKSGQTGTISLSLKLSSPVENIQIKEYIPSTWEVLNVSNNGTISESTSTYNVITWNITGDNIKASYKIKAPEVGYLTTYEYLFQTELDKTILLNTTIKVFKVTTILKKVPYRFDKIRYKSKLISKVSNNSPIISSQEDFVGALYSTIPLEDASLDLTKSEYKGIFDPSFKQIKSYKINTNLQKEEREKTIFEYKAEKSFLEKNNFKRIVIFDRIKKTFSEIQGNIVTSDKTTITYRFETTRPVKEVYIFAEKNNLNTIEKFQKLRNNYKQ